MDNEKDIAIQIEGLKKKYRLGTIGGGTLVGDLQSWWARKRGKEDPNSKIGAKIYGKNETFMALDGIDFTVYKGERIGIIGHNGAGKSTLLKLLSRVTGPTEGVIKLDGRISSMLEVGTGFNGELTGRENIYLNGAILGMTKAEVDSKMEDIIEFSEVRQFIDTPVKRYSSGMYVKLAFSVAAHLDSEILIMDEVLAVGDMAFQKKCLDKMSQVSKDEGRTILYVSHNMNTIRQLCDRCIVLDHGKVVFNGDVEEAIGVYLGKELDEKKVYDLTCIARSNNTTGFVELKRIELLEKSNQLPFNSELHFKLCFNCSSKVPNLRFRFCVSRHDGTIVATTITDAIQIKYGFDSFKCFKLDLAGLAPSKYVLKLVAFEQNEIGRQITHDVVNKTLAFQVLDDERLLVPTWNSMWWGNQVLPNAIQYD